MEKSPIDELFFKLFGYYPNKAGKAYELIADAVLKIVTGDNVKYDQYKRGAYSKTVFQIDGELENNNAMIEAKDYTLKNKKVGRGDLQKMQGALGDLEYTEGIFASATDYTGPADKYADASTENPLHKPIQLFHIRPSTLLDEQGRLKRIEMNLIAVIPDYANGEYVPHYTNDAIKLMHTEGLLGKTIQFRLDAFYNLDGTFNISMPDFSLDNQPISQGIDDPFAEGCYALYGLGALYEGKVYALKGIYYKIPHIQDSTTIVIEAEGTPRILVKSKDGTIDKLITEEQLKQFSFANGNVIDQQH